MKKRILKLYENDVIRYIFWGGCTTLVNLVSFYIMRELGIILMAANVVSIILAILFAYVVNSRFVFHDQCATLADHIRPLFGCWQLCWDFTIWLQNSAPSLLCWC